MKGMYETGGSLCGLGLGASVTANNRVATWAPLHVSDSATSLVVPSGRRPKSDPGSDPAGSDAYAHPSTHWSPANPDADATVDPDFGTDHAGRCFVRNWGGSTRNPCLGRQWAADLGGYRAARSGFGKPTRTFVSTLFHQEV